MDREDNREEASATGIVFCLRLLAEEAGTLGMNGTRAAILDALETAGRECASGPVPEAWPVPEHPRTH